jgi:phosphatidylglycerophosphatase A
MSTTPEPAARRLGWAALRDPRLAVALGFGAGLVPRAPGTAGSLLGLALAFALSGLPLAISGGVLAALFMLGVTCSQRAITRTGLDDPGVVVWDEVVGMAAVLWGVAPGLPAYAAGFVLFRLFDIWKPWPIRTLDRTVHGGFGVMLDDLAAALAAGVLLQVLLLASAGAVR